METVTRSAFEPGRGTECHGCVILTSARACASIATCGRWQVLHSKGPRILWIPAIIRQQRKDGIQNSVVGACLHLRCVFYAEQ